MPLLKTDSLPVIFLKYETELLTKNPTDSITATILPNSIKPITEKDWKDQSNILNKQNSVKNSSNDLVEKVFTSDKDKLTSLKNSLTNLLEGVNQKSYETSRKLLQTSPEINTTTTPKPIKLEPLPKSLLVTRSNLSSPPIVTALAPLSPFPQINLKSLLLGGEPSPPPPPSSTAAKDSDINNFIDPQLINICDNLQINKQIDSDLTSTTTSISSPDSIVAAKILPAMVVIPNHIKSQTSLIPIVAGGKSGDPPARTSADKKNLLKRQIHLGKLAIIHNKLWE